MYSGYCDACGKRMYATRKLANKMKKVTFPGDHLRSYPCPEDGRYFHIGHMRELVIRGLE
jgi:hypothetical protein